MTRRPDAPSFDAAVGSQGYAWWYIDALSDDGAHGLTIIAFIGSVFSPYYFWAGRRDPLDHVALNVALYGPRGNRWAMTERGRGSLTRDAARLSIGPSALRWDGDALVVDFTEIGMPIPRGVRGQARIMPAAFNAESVALDPQRRHVWQPIAPRARVEVRLTDPVLSWSGTGYVDANTGSEPLEAGFADWQWSRAHLRADTAVFYEGVRRDGSAFALALRFDAAGRATLVEAPPPAPLPRTAWRVGRATHADAGAAARVVKTWEDSPFYARSTVATRLFGEDALAVHESLSLDRFRLPIVKAMLPFRMPRRR